MEMKIVIQVPESVEALIKTMLKGSPAKVEIAGVESPALTAEPNVETTKKRGRPRKESEPASAVEQPSTVTPSTNSSTTTEPSSPTAQAVTTPTSLNSSESDGPSLENIRDLVLKTKNGIEISKSILAEMGCQKIGELTPEQRVDFVAKLGML